MPAPAGRSPAPGPASPPGATEDGFGIFELAVVAMVAAAVLMALLTQV